MESSKAGSLNYRNWLM